MIIYEAHEEASEGVVLETSPDQLGRWRSSSGDAFFGCFSGLAAGITYESRGRSPLRGIAHALRPARG